MAASDALIVGEDWISEHYFTTDAKSESFQAKVAERRKAWDEDTKNGAATVRSRFIAARARLGTSIADLLANQPGTADDSLPELYPDLRGVLGYDSGEYILKRTGPVIGVIDSGPRRGRTACHRRGAGRRDHRGPDRQGRQDAPDPVRGRREDDVHVGGAAAVGAVRRGRRTRVRPGPGGPVAARRRAGPLGRGPLPGRRPAAGLRAQRRPRAAARSTAPSPASARSRSRRTPRAASGGTASSRTRSSTPLASPQDLREGVRLSIEIIANEVVRRRKAQGPRPAAAGPGAAARPAGAAVPVPDPVPALRGGVARA